MKTYIVGGAVRDLLMEKEPSDLDYVVVGATADQMLSQGFEQVGRDFPVFLHPETRDEYALARTVRASQQVASGTQWDSDPTITLEQDLGNRDLTVNAIALDPVDNTVVDPFKGVADIKKRCFRHVSEHTFEQDPLRVLRVARMMARHSHQGWQIAPQTNELMKHCAEKGLLDDLVPERVYKELSRALEEPSPSAFITALRECGALGRVLPEVEGLFGVPQPSLHHPEIDSGIHTLMVLDQAATLSNRLDVRFAALVHDLGKAVTPESEWPRHIMHEKRGVPLVGALCERLCVPGKTAHTAKLVTEHHLRVHQSQAMKATTLTQLINKLHDKNRPDQLQDVLTACEADAKGRLGFEQTRYPQYQFMLAMNEAASAIDRKAVAQRYAGDGQKIKEGIYRAQVLAVKQARSQYLGKAPHEPSVSSLGIK